MKRLTKLLPLFFLLFSLLPVSSVKAEERVGYSVQAHLPENQRDPSLSYFDLRVEPNQEQELNVTIYNHENEEITVRATIHNASTNSNGLVVYEEQEEMDPSLHNPITELVTLEEEEWTIPAGESETISAKLEMPDESFDGIKLGGFHFEKVPEEIEAEEGVTIQNRYAYVIGMQLSENDQEVAPNLELLSVEPQLVNHRIAVVAQVQNEQPVLMGNITIQAQVYEENSDEPLREIEQTDIRMAPNSTMDFVMDWNNQALQEGHYRVDMSATDSENTWEWQEEFTISEEAETLNEEAVEIESSQDYSNWYIAGIVALASIVIVLLIYIGRLKKKS